jgi:uncharacterized membrane protein
MRKIFLFVFLLLASFCLTNFSLAQEKITNFYVTVELKHDSSVAIEEVIQYDFGASRHHGIYREIPVSYQTSKGRRSISISQVLVTDKNDNELPSKISSEGKNLKIRIGDPNKYVLGEKYYRIKYVVKRAINYFDDYDEFYWNITGNDWDVPINRAFAKIILPESIQRNNLQLVCFQGRQGSKEECSMITPTGSQKNQIKEIIFSQFSSSFNDPGLSRQEGLTIVVGLPKGILKEPSFFENFLSIVWDNKIVFLPLITILFLFCFWYKKGRDPKGRGTIIAHYEAPDDLSPIELGTIVDERVDRRDLSAEIIHLAVNGYIRIKRLQKKTLIFSWGNDYLLKQLKIGDTLTKGFQRELLEDIFKKGKQSKEKGIIREIKLSELKNKFYADSQKLIRLIYNRVVQQGYFVKNPRKVKGTFITISILIVFIGRPFLLSILSSTGLIGEISMAICSIAFFLFGLIMPKKTKKGVLTKEKILGLKEYLEVAEKARIKFHNAPKKDPQLFEKLLPYAMVLEVEKEWARQFEGIYKGSPSWYEDTTFNSFAPLYLISSMHDFSKNTNENLFSSSRGAAGGHSGFGGGGFSGGGFGGGGGGSW